MADAKQRLVIVGAGPAGIAAAVEARRLGLDVTLLDEDSRIGGQYYRGDTASMADGSPGWFERQGPGIELRLETAVFDAPSDRLLAVWNPKTGCDSIAYEAVIVATGAYDRPVPLPGWTLPGVVTSGAALTFAKAYDTLIGRRFLLGGSGASLMTAADALSARGAKVTLLEATPLGSSLSGLGTLMPDWPVLSEALCNQLRLLLRGVHTLYGRMITSVDGDGRVQRATFHRVDAEWRPVPGTGSTVEVDSVGLGFGLVPRLDVAQLLGCAIVYDAACSTHVVRVDGEMRTSRRAIYAAGETTGIAGARVARFEGRLAALTAAFDLGAITGALHRARLRNLMEQLAPARRIARWLAHTYRPRAALWSLAQMGTVLCRCEEVTLRDVEETIVANSVTPHAVKMATRAGMGLCQGRICSAAITEILRTRHGYEVPKTGYPWSLRPPIRPIPMGDWAALTIRSEGKQTIPASEEGKAVA